MEASFSVIADLSCRMGTAARQRNRIQQEAAPGHRSRVPDDDLKAPGRGETPLDRARERGNRLHRRRKQPAR